MELNDGMVKIILALIGLLGTIVTYFLIPYLKTKTTKEQRNELAFWLGVAMTSAEYVFDIPKSGPEKKEFVMKFIKSKINIKDADLSMLIDTIINRYNEAKGQFTDIDSTIMDAVAQFVV